MKKIFALILVLLILSGSLVVLLPWGLPEDDPKTEAIFLSDGSWAQGENRDYVSRIYFWEKENLKEIYTESRIPHGRERKITHLCDADGQIRFLRIYSGGQDWELAGIEAEKAVLLAEGTFSEGYTVTGLASGPDGCWLTGLEKDGSISIYETAGETVTLFGIIPPDWYPGTVSARYDGNCVHLANADGEQYFGQLDVKQLQTSHKENAVPPELPKSQDAWLQYKIMPGFAVLVVFSAVSFTILIAGLISRFAGRLSVRMTAVGCEIMLLGLTAVGAISCGAVHYTSGLEAFYSVAKIQIYLLLITWGISAIILGITAAGIMHPLHVLKRQMTEIADGKRTPHTASKGRDEISRMNRAMQEMLMDLSIRDYELESTIQSYQRFVPEKMTELLERASVGEVSLGDNSSIVGNVGSFTVGNREEARRLLDDDAFITFVNHSFKTLYSCIKENSGSLLSNALRISAVEILFPREAADGVRTGLDLLGNTFKRPQENVPAPKPFLMLHRTSFIYGVSGEKNRLFPYFSSSELDFLGGFAENFHETNTQIVMTDSYLNELKDHQISTRYIGFVSDGDTKTYKLYEVLDGYAELERELRMGYDKRFQEGIQLFYRNDFYLARNLFSDLLRVCPGDGIVRWYLFACEHYFDCQGREELNYQLFGIQEND